MHVVAHISKLSPFNSKEMFLSLKDRKPNSSWVYNASTLVIELTGCVGLLIHMY